ncbi:lipid II flippase MurJ, partial [Acinetobacter baumannii]
AAALPAQVLAKALAPAFFARGDTQTPLRAALIGAAVSIALAFLLGRLFAASGIAAGLALGAWANALLLIRLGAARFGFAIEP